MSMSKLLPGVILGLMFSLCGDAAFGGTTPPDGGLTLVEGGQPRAEIVVAPERPRMVTLAALELQHYLQKISRARLPIVTSPSNTQSVKIYIGESEGTKKLGVTAEGLKYGAFRIVTGADSIVLIGQDKDYVPRKPFPAKRKDRERAAAEWDEQVKDKTVGWGFPLASEFKGYWNPGNLAEIFNSRYGADGLAFWQGDNPQLEGFWQRDNCGSLNATYEFLPSGSVMVYAGRSGRGCTRVGIGHLSRHE